nr:MAG TPA: hypothetical protein [Caudoviricetes sp.]
MALCNFQPSWLLLPYSQFSSHRVMVHQPTVLRYMCENLQL